MAATMKITGTDMTTKYEHRVQYYETDKMNCVHHSNYIRWFEEARTDLMEKNGFGYGKMEAIGLMSPVVHVEADYRSMARFGETVEIETKIERYTGVKIFFSYLITDVQSGALRCTGKSEHCFLNESGRPIALKKVYPEYHSAISLAADTEQS